VHGFVGVSEIEEEETLLKNLGINLSRKNQAEWGS
jgi:hypothetical protein